MTKSCIKTTQIILQLELSNILATATIIIKLSATDFRHYSNKDE